MELFIWFLIFVSVFPIMAFIPYLTRRTESFGISIPEEVFEHVLLREMRRKYALMMSVIAVFIVVVTLACFFLMEVDMGLLIPVTVVGYIILSFAVYLKFHYQMKRLKLAENWQETRPERVVIDTSFRGRPLTFSNYWFAIAALIVGGTFLLTYLNYDALPEQIPMQYDFEGNVTWTAEKSWLAVFVLPLTQLLMLGLFISTNLIIQYSKQQINASNPEKSMAQNYIFRRRWSAFSIIVGTLMVILFAVIQMTVIFQLSTSILLGSILTITLGIVGGAVFLAITTGQGGSRVTVGDGEQEHKINRDDDQYWKLGQIYINRDDPALFIEKRFGIGWTVNLARPLVWLVLLLLIGLPILLVILV